VVVQERLRKLRRDFDHLPLSIVEAWRVFECKEFFALGTGSNYPSVNFGRDPTQSLQSVLAFEVLLGKRIKNTVNSSVRCMDLLQFRECCLPKIVVPRGPIFLIRFGNFAKLFERRWHGLDSFAFNGVICLGFNDDTETRIYERQVPSDDFAGLA